jgi:hypothetical protein
LKEATLEITPKCKILPEDTGVPGVNFELAYGIDTASLPNYATVDNTVPKVSIRATDDSHIGDTFPVTFSCSVVGYEDKIATHQFTANVLVKAPEIVDKIEEIISEKEKDLE